MGKSAKRLTRNVLLAATVAMATALALPVTASAEHDAGNPATTEGDAALELRAVRMLKNPVIEAAKRDTAQYWLDTIKPSDEVKALFPEAFDEVAFCGILNALNADPYHPEIHTFGLFAHAIKGVSIPASQCGIPNPDTIYRFMPVDGTSRYVITGHADKRFPGGNNFSLLTSSLNTISNLTGRDLIVDPHGNFTITIDPDPGKSGTNHIRTTPDAFQIIIRDTLEDYRRQRPNRLEVRRVGGPPAPMRPTDDALAQSAAQWIKKMAVDTNHYNLPALVGPENGFKTPEIQHPVDGFLVTQAYSIGRYKLNDDEALVFTLRLGGADYAVVPLTNIWGTFAPFETLARHVLSLNTSQAAPNPDGSYTVVVAPNDPGIENWVDTAGGHEGTIFVRWVGFDPTKSSQKPSLDAKVVKLADLPSILPPGMRKFDKAARQRQIADHTADYASK